MLTFQQAREIAAAEISKQWPNDDSLLIIDDLTIDKEYAWIFQYTSKRYWETKDITFAPGGNSPLFVSKMNGKISSYRTGLSLDEMINEYEEENKIWNLILTDDVYGDTKKMSFLRKVLDLQLDKISDFKTNTAIIISSGAKTRLSSIQKRLGSKNIRTGLYQRNVKDKTK